METLTTDIPIEEWDRARLLFDVAGTNERNGLSQIRLRSDGRMRRWYATDAVRAACFAGGPDAGVYDVGIPSSLLRFSAGESEEADELQLVVDPVRHVITLRSTTRVVEAEDLDYSFPSEETIRPPDSEMAGRASVSARDLFNAVGAAWMARGADLDDGATHLAGGDRGLARIAGGQSTSERCSRAHRMWSDRSGGSRSEREVPLVGRRSLPTR